MSRVLKTRWLIGILILACFKIPIYNWVVFHPLYNPTNQGFDNCSSGYVVFFIMANQPTPP